MDRFTGCTVKRIVKETTKSKKEKEILPGPGQYKIPCSIVDFPKYVTTHKFDLNYRYV